MRFLPIILLALTFILLPVAVFALGVTTLFVGHALIMYLTFSPYLTFVACLSLTFDDAMELLDPYA